MMQGTHQQHNRPTGRRFQAKFVTSIAIANENQLVRCKKYTGPCNMQHEMSRHELKILLTDKEKFRNFESAFYDIFKNVFLKKAFHNNCLSSSSSHQMEFLIRIGMVYFRHLTVPMEEDVKLSIIKDVLPDGQSCFYVEPVLRNSIDKLIKLMYESFHANGMIPQRHHPPEIAVTLLLGEDVTQDRLMLHYDAVTYKFICCRLETVTCNWNIITGKSKDYQGNYEDVKDIRLQSIVHADQNITKWTGYNLEDVTDILTTDCNDDKNIIVRCDWLQHGHSITAVQEVTRTIVPLTSKEETLNCYARLQSHIVYQPPDYLGTRVLKIRNNVTQQLFVPAKSVDQDKCGFHCVMPQVSKDDFDKQDNIQVIWDAIQAFANLGQDGSI